MEARKIVFVVSLVTRNVCSQNPFPKILFTLLYASSLADTTKYSQPVCVCIILYSGRNHTLIVYFRVYQYQYPPELGITYSIWRVTIQCLKQLTQIAVQHRALKL